MGDSRWSQMYKRVAFACNTANPQKILQRHEEKVETRDRDAPITSGFSMLESDFHTAEVRAVMNVVKSRSHRTEHNLGTAVVLGIDFRWLNNTRSTLTTYPYYSRASLQCASPISQGLRRTYKVPSVPQQLLKSTYWTKYT